MRVLIICGDKAESGVIELVFRDAGASTYATDSGEEGVELARCYGYDMIIINAPPASTDLCNTVKLLRKGNTTVPILIVAQPGSVEEKVESFAAGADDYLLKPFDREEIIARVHAIVRRSKGHAHSVIRTGKLALNLTTKTLDVDGRPVHLTHREYQMMALMFLNKGLALTKEEFMDHLYGGMDEPDVKMIDVLICKIRKKLATVAGGDGYIHTVWGRGYLLHEPTEEGLTAA